MATGTSSIFKIVAVAAVGAGVIGLLSLRHRPTPVVVVPPAVTTVTTAMTTPSAMPSATPSATVAKHVDLHDPAIVDAALAGDLAKVETLADAGVKLDGTLSVAARSGNLAMVKWLLDHGVDAHENEGSTLPPILEADAHDDIVALLLARGAAEPSLEDAVRTPAPKAVARLIAAGADPRAASASGSTPLALAVDQGSLPILKALLAHGAKVDAATLTAAVDSEHPETLDVLLAAPLERNATLKAISRATLSKNAAIIKRLAAKGVAWTALDREEDPSLVNAARALDLATVRALLDAGAPIDQVADAGDTALQAALDGHGTPYGRVLDDMNAIVKALLDRGANANRRFADGRFPLDIADAADLTDVVKLLKARGAKHAPPAPTPSQ